MKLHTLTPHESRMHPIDFEVKGQGHGAWLFENGFRTITDSIINLWSWNFIHLLTMSQGCALLILRSKGQRSRSWRMVIWKWFPDDNWLCNQPMIMKLHTLTHHESRMCPIDFEVKGQGHGAWLFENGFRTITDSVINLWSWNFIHLLTMSQGCTLLILRSKGQRSRSWRMVIWKWFPDDNWLCNQPMIMKLHTLTPHESRMCPIDFGVERSTVKVMAHGYLKMVHRNNGCRFEFVGVGGGPVLLQQYFQYAFICCPYMLPLLLCVTIRSNSTIPQRVALARTFKEAGLRSPRTQLTKVQIEISVQGRHTEASRTCERFPICDDKITENDRCVIKIIGIHCTPHGNVGSRYQQASLKD